MKAVESGLRAVSVRMRAQKVVQWGSFGFMGGSVFALLLGAASFFWPLEQVIFYGVGSVSGCWMLGGLAGFLWPISTRQAAKRADACGLMARVQTALELQGAPETPMTELQKADALAALRAMDAREAMPLRPHRLSQIISLVCAVLATSLFLIPNPQHQVLRARVGFRQEMQKQAKLLETGADQLDSTEKQAAQEVRKLLGDLARELRTASEPRRALEAINQAEQKLSELRQSSTAPMRNALSQSGVSALAAAMEQQDAESMREALENGDNEALAKALSQAAESMGDSADADALKEAAEAISAGNSHKALTTLNAAAAASASCATQGSALTQMAQMGVARASQALGTSAQGSASQAMAALGAIGQQAGMGSGQGAGSGGSSQGGGSGAGQGTTNRDAGYMNSTSRASQGSGAAPQEKLAEYEKIYDPTRLGGTGEVANERGTIGEGEISQFSINGGIGSISETVPYPEVALEYQDSAVQSVQNADLPAYVQNWVKNYFQSLLD